MSEVWRVEGGRPDGPAVIALHGWGGSRWEMLPLLPSLTSGAKCVYLVDLPGHGDSPAKRFEWGQGDWKRLENWIEQVVEREAGTPVVLAGRSIGANLAMGLARRQPERVKAVVLESPVTGYLQAAWLVQEIWNLPGSGCRWILEGMLKRRAAGNGLWPANFWEFAQPVLVLAREGDPFSPLPELRKQVEAKTAGYLEVLPLAGGTEASPLKPLGEAFAAFLVRVTKKT